LKRKKTSRSDAKSTSLPTNGSKNEYETKKTKKITVSLALDENVVEEIKAQAAKMEQSFNARVNAILEKYVRFFMHVEQERAAIITRSTHQFFVDEIDEQKYTAELKRLGTDIIDAMFVQTGMANTIDNLVKFTFEGLCVNGGSITSVKKYVDEEGGKMCLYFTHDYGLKWSRILSAAFAHHIQSVLHCHTTTKLFSEGFEIKILEKNPA
jgi:hypothetical protein